MGLKSSLSKVSRAVWSHDEASRKAIQGCRKIAGRKRHKGQGSTKFPTTGKGLKKGVAKKRGEGGELVFSY